MTHNAQQVKPIIYCTKKYDKFRILETNREVRKNHVNEIVESIKRENRLHLEPITIDKDFYVYDGQHRIEAARILNVDIYYMINENANLESMIDSQISRKWFLEDYLRHYVIRKYPEYVKFKDIMTRYELDVTSLFNLVSRQKYDLAKVFKKGELKIPESVENFVKDSYELRTFLKNNLKNNLKKSINRRNFISALMKIWKNYFEYWNSFSGIIIGKFFDITFPDIDSYEGYYAFFAKTYNKYITKSGRKCSRSMQECLTKEIEG